MTNFTFDILLSLPEIYLATSSFLLLLFGVLMSVSKKKGYPLLANTFSFLSFQAVFFYFLFSLQFPYVNLLLWDYFLVSNFFVWVAKIILSLVVIVWIFISKSYIIQEKLNSFEYWVLILFIVLALLLVLQSYDLLVTYLLIEFQSLAFYVLASFKRSSEFSTEAGLKYFVLGAFSSAFLLFGSSLLYGLTGLTNFADFNIFFTSFLTEDKSLVFSSFIGLLFITSALFFKISASPFHMWAPDVYEGSPTSVTAFFSIFPKLVIISLLLRIFFFTFHDFFSIWKNIVIIVSFLSLLFGSLGALSQKKWKRFLAYSSISHIGFILIGFLSGEVLGITSILLYLFIYVITTLGVFTFLLGFRFYKCPTDSQTRYLYELVGLSKVNPLLSVSLILILFSMAGIPPLSGFFAKVFVLLIGIQSSSYNLVFFSVIMSSISCFYYIRIIQVMYFLNFNSWPVVNPMTKLNSLILGISCLFILLFFIDIELFSIPATRMALTFLS
uniref:NADH dehydrogenase subunit 2 n=1 Tax=Lithothamnion sp. TaxID=1940749 RepID=A0A3G3MID7_9FLOR|nr:NADH dehydrogenase subunit 2 [Lithothamnion sp.]